jgi:hypothetical protein
MPIARRLTDVARSARHAEILMKFFFRRMA